MSELQVQINSGSIHMMGNFFLDVEHETEKAVKVQYLGRLHWLPKYAFQPRKFGSITVYGLQSKFINKIMQTF